MSTCLMVDLVPLGAPGTVLKGRGARSGGSTAPAKRSQA